MDASCSADYALWRQTLVALRSFCSTKSQQGVYMEMTGEAETITVFLKREERVVTIGRNSKHPAPHMPQGIETRAWIRRLCIPGFGILPVPTYTIVEQNAPDSSKLPQEQPCHPGMLTFCALPRSKTPAWNLMSLCCDDAACLLLAQRRDIYLTWALAHLIMDRKYMGVPGEARRTLKSIRAALAGWLV